MGCSAAKAGISIYLSLSDSELCIPISFPLDSNPRKAYENRAVLRREAIDLGASTGPVYITSSLISPSTSIALPAYLHPRPPPPSPRPPLALGSIQATRELLRLMRGRQWRCPRLLLLRRRRGSGCSATGRSVPVPVLSPADLTPYLKFELDSLSLPPECFLVFKNCTNAKFLPFDFWMERA